MAKGPALTRRGYLFCGKDALKPCAGAPLAAQGQRNGRIR